MSHYYTTFMWLFDTHKGPIALYNIITGKKLSLRGSASGEPEIRKEEI